MDFRNLHTVDLLGCTSRWALNRRSTFMRRLGYDWRALNYIVTFDQRLTLSYRRALDNRWAFDDREALDNEWSSFGAYNR